jgi:hypothetical protein
VRLRQALAERADAANTLGNRTRLLHTAIAIRRRVTAGERQGSGANQASARVAGVNVRRLAAIDMYGSYGTPRRRRIVVAEFVVGVLVTVAVGVTILIAASSTGGRAFGWWMTGAGLNYAPLAVHAITLSRPGALDRELSGIDPGPELRRYAILQLWILLPLSLVVWDVSQRLHPSREP